MEGWHGLALLRAGRRMPLALRRRALRQSGLVRRRRAGRRADQQAAAPRLQPVSAGLRWHFGLPIALRRRASGRLQGSRRLLAAPPSAGRSASADRPAGLACCLVATSGAPAKLLRNPQWDLSARTGSTRAANRRWSSADLRVRGLRAAAEPRRRCVYRGCLGVCGGGGARSPRERGPPLAPARRAAFAVGAPPTPQPPLTGSAQRDTPSTHSLTQLVIERLAWR
jgi:hypothetical protein